MSRRPFVKFFVSDWLAGTRGLSAAETGVYITLIAMMYERGGPIEEDHRRLSRLCGCAKPTFSKIIGTLADLGKISRADGRLKPQITDDGIAAPAFDPNAYTAERTPLPLALRAAIMERDDARCVYCGDTEGPHEIDHICCDPRDFLHLMLESGRARGPDDEAIEVQ